MALDKGLFLTSALSIALGIVILSTSTTAVAQTMYCDPAALHQCNCRDTGGGFVCVGTTINLYWCSSYPYATCQANVYKNVPRRQPTPGRARHLYGWVPINRPNLSTYCTGILLLKTGVIASR